MNRNAKWLVFAGLVLCLLASVSIESGITGAIPQQRSSLRRSRAVQKAGELFRRDCARCHGGDGRGDTPLGHLYQAPDFTDPEWWQEHSGITSTRSLVSIVSHGKGGMPAFGKKLTRPEISLLVNYIRRFRNRSGTTSSK